MFIFISARENANQSTIFGNEIFTIFGNEVLRVYIPFMQ